MKIMVLVTGGTGLVGAHIIAGLVGIGVPVRALKRENSKTQIVDDLIDFYGIEKRSEVEWVPGDVMDYYSLKDALKGAKHVYHTAAMVTFNPNLEKTLRDVNEKGTINMLNASIEAGVEKFAFVSSIATLGNSVNGYPIDETCIWQADEKHNVYAESKFRAEMEVKRASMEGLKTIIVNPSFIIGPGDSTRSSGQVFMRVKNGLAFYTSGSTGYVHARDVADAMIMLMESDIENERFILNSDNMPLKDFFDAVAKKMHSKTPYIKAGKFILDFAWRFEYLKFKLTGTEPVISRESAKIARTDYSYTSKKLVEATGFKFRPVDEAISDAVAFMEKYGH